jgi:hypothetical protein
MSKLERVKARTAARKAAGQIPVYARHRKEKGATKPAKTTARTPMPCVHLGAATGETRPCQGCGGRVVQVPLRACKVYGVCSESRVVKLAGGEPVKCCRAVCPSYRPPA